MIRLIFLSLLLTGCMANNPWSMDGIATGNSSFDSKRIRYRSLQTYPALQFEIVKMGDHIEAFLSLTRYHLSDSQVKILFTAANGTFEDQVPVHEGGMRVRLSADATHKLIQALQDGQKVDILMDGFEETLEPTQFSSFFSKLESEGYFFENLFKGPLE